MKRRTLSETLEYWRQTRGLSVGKVAQAIGIHRTTWGRWTSGKSFPSAREMDAAFQVLNVPAEDRKNALTSWNAPRALALLEREEINPSMALGDLLRALRLRARLTQADAARQAGITQGLLARWENHGSVPDSAKLHALCYALGATAEETAALTTGAYREQSPLPKNEDEWKFAFNQLIYFTAAPCKDLMFLAHTAHLVRLSRSDAFYKDQFSDVWGRQALHIAEQSGRSEEALRCSAAALSLSNRAVPFNGHVVSAIVAHADISARKFGAVAGISSLQRWEANIEVPALLDWVTSRKAVYLADSGDINSALGLIRDTYNIARERRDEAYGDFLARRRDYAILLLRAGDGATALRVLADDQADGTDSPPVSEVCRDTLLLAEAHLQTKQATEASRYLTTVQTLITEHNLPYRDQFNRLTSRMH